MSVQTLVLSDVVNGVMTRAFECSPHASELSVYLTKAQTAGFQYDCSDVPAKAQNVIKVLQHLSQELPDITPALWVTLAHIAAIHGEEEQSLMFAPELPINAEFADACLHAALLTTPLWLHINAQVSKQAGVVFQHLCGCGCHLTPGVVKCNTVAQLATSVVAFYQHLAGQFHLLKEGFPFNLS